MEINKEIDKSVVNKIAKAFGPKSIGIVPSLYLSLTCRYDHYVNEVPEALLRCGATPSERKSVLRCLLREYINCRDRKEGDNIAQKMVKIQYLKPFNVAALLLQKQNLF